MKYEGEFEKSLNVSLPGLAATRTALARLLRSIDTVGWSSHEESGRLDRHALTRYAVGDANIFSRRMYQEADTAAVQLLIDCSGSMCGREIEVAQDFAVQLGKILNKTKTSFACYGFKSGSSDERGDGVVFYPFKHWNKSFGPSMGAINSHAGGGTPDYTAIWHGINIISQRPEKRKVLFIIGDSNGYDVESMKHLERMANKLGVTVIGIGIGYTDMPKCFTNATNVFKVQDLCGTGFKSILKSLGARQ